MTTDAPPDRPTVLVVDDTPANQLLLRHALEQHYRVELADSGAAALARVRSGALPDIVLLDVVMPGLDGYEVCRRLKQDPLTARIPVVFLTARGDSRDEIQGFACGAVDYIVKPAPSALVRARVHNHLELKRTQDRLASANRALQGQVAALEVGMGALAAMGDALGKLGAQHTRRVQHYVDCLAGQLAGQPGHEAWADPEGRQRLVSAAALYDLGKIGIPEAILCKPGGLTPQERERVQTHAELGGQALQSVISAAEAQLGVSLAQDPADSDAGAGPLGFLALARDLALSHHEHWDGSGYPLGLQAGQIPAGARLLAVADVYDALRSRRPHKAPWARATVCEYLLAGRGRQFAPEVIDAWQVVEPQWDAIWLRHSEPGERV